MRGCHRQQVSQQLPLHRHRWQIRGAHDRPLPPLHPPPDFQALLTPLRGGGKSPTGTADGSRLCGEHIPGSLAYADRVRRSLPHDERADEAANQSPPAHRGGAFGNRFASGTHQPDRNHRRLSCQCLPSRGARFARLANGSPFTPDLGEHGPRQA